jgi:hypothetical protein
MAYRGDTGEGLPSSSSCSGVYAPGEKEGSSMGPETLNAKPAPGSRRGVVGGFRSVDGVRRFCALARRGLDRRRRHRDDSAAVNDQEFADCRGVVCINEGRAGCSSFVIHLLTMGL